MIKEKIKTMLKYRNALQNELLDVLKVSSKQALTNKFTKQQFTLQELIMICDYLGMEIVVKDKRQNKIVCKLDSSDL